MTRTILTVQGMSCEHCRMAVTRAASSVAGVSAVEVDLENGTVSFDCEESPALLDSVRRAIGAQGYTVL